MLRTLLVALGLLFVAPVAAERYMPLTVYTPPITNMTVYVPPETYCVREEVPDSSTTGMHPIDSVEPTTTTTGVKYGYLRGGKLNLPKSA